MTSVPCEIVVLSHGNVRHVYTEQIGLDSLGTAQITRGSHVEPDTDGTWTADLSPVGGPCLRGYEHRSDALAAELEWLHQHWLIRGDEHEH